MPKPVAEVGEGKLISRRQRQFFPWFTLDINIGDFRFEYKYEIEYENDFSVLVCWLYIITTQTHLIP